MIDLETIRPGDPGRTIEPTRCQWCKADIPIGSIVSLRVMTDSKTFKPKVTVMHRDCFEVEYRSWCLRNGYRWSLGNEFWKRWEGHTCSPSLLGPLMVDPVG